MTNEQPDSQTEQFYKTLINVADEMQKIANNLRASRILFDDVSNERDSLKRKLTQANLDIDEIRSQHQREMNEFKSDEDLIVERDDLKRQVNELQSRLEVKDNNLKEGCAVELEQEDTIYQLRAENTELLKDRKRLERLMTLERGDLLWFYQEQDKRRALDILMEDEE